MYNYVSALQENTGHRVHIDVKSRLATIPKYRANTDGDPLGGVTRVGFART